jgi:2-oxoglutarate ferredoxin oxidoreductase subunit gamma
VPNSNVPNQIPIPATKIASQDLKSVVSANMIMLGFFAGRHGLINKESFIEAIKRQVSEKYLAINLKAFEIGFDQGIKKGV